MLSGTRDLLKARRGADEAASVQPAFAISSTTPAPTIPVRRPVPRVRSEVPRLLWIIIGVLLLFWLVGVATNVVGALVHILLAVIVVVVVMQLLQGRRSA